jgi:hypothetical protein
MNTNVNNVVFVLKDSKKSLLNQLQTARSVVVKWVVHLTDRVADAKHFAAKVALRGQKDEGCNCER